MKIVGIIPARYGSSRFPGKPLAHIYGRSMIEYVYKGVRENTKLFDLVVATDDRRIYDAVIQFGGKAVMTSGVHATGTERCIEVASNAGDIDWIINIQGDEPLISGKLLDEVIVLIESAVSPSIITMVRKMDSASEAENANIVKCVFDQSGKALYFSRSPVPSYRGATEKIYYQHLGIYAYKKEVLLQLGSLSPTPLESAESLEQLRWMEHGYSIQTGITEYIAYGVDIPEDIARIEKQMADYKRKDLLNE